eukprot:COSAG02_NODE_1038_length_15049_cov_895.063144_6_plen_84_part_00
MCSVEDGAQLARSIFDVSGSGSHSHRRCRRVNDIVLHRYALGVEQLRGEIYGGQAVYDRYSAHPGGECLLEASASLALLLRPC